MRNFSRAALAVASFFCLLATATVSAPSFAAEGSAPAGTATAMLAAVTAPMLAVDVKALQERDPDFSTYSTPAAPAGSPDQTADAAPRNLADLVNDRLGTSTGDEQGDCLATSVYFESKGEPLDGQLAVAQTILHRTTSSRFAGSVCNVVKQPGQFSFIRRGEMPNAPRDSRAWKQAVAIALIARDGQWKQVAPDALFFHARRVSPGWGKTKVALLGNHIFFR